MTPAQWEHLCELFEAALERPADKQRDFVDGLIREPAELREELLSLLDEHQDDATFFPALDAAPVAAALGLNSEMPASIGPYAPVRELGRGGMAVVYLARRADGQFEQEVALKLVRRGVDSEELQRRFLFERQLLARLKHPGIARLVDGGVAPGGRAWFAMEYVDGSPLFDYCDANALNLNARLDLFLQVCDAVDHAHRNLVVHRDLKPANILVTSAGEVRLLDFGIAKLLDEEGMAGVHGQTSPATRASLLLLTPEYGAPEQVSGAPITTATDVYALGVILYELMTGLRPYDFANRSAVEIQRTLLTTQPPRPSTALRNKRLLPAGSPIPDTEPADLQPRRKSQAAWVRRLRGDLDVIVMTALAKEPERRFASAGALGDDIRRTLAHQPIRARPDSLSYVAGRFMRRHWLPVGAALVAILGLVAGLATAAWQGQVAAREGRRAASVSSFLVEMLATVNPDQAQGREVTVRQVLDEAAVRLNESNTQVSTDPAVESAVRATIADTYRALGEYEAATDQGTRALALSQDSLGPRHADTVKRLSELGAIYFDWGRIEEAEPLYTQAQRIALETLGEEHELSQRIAVQLAGIYMRRGEFTQAETVLRRVLAERRRTLGADDTQTLMAQGNLASVLGAKGQFDEARALLTDVVQQQRASLGSGHRHTLVSIANLARAHRSTGDYDAAIALEEEVLATRRNVLDADHPELLEAMLSLATTYTDADDWAQALPLFNEALPRQYVALGARHWKSLAYQANYATALAGAGRTRDAVREWNQAIAGLLQTLGADHPMTKGIIADRDNAAHSGVAESE